MSLSAPELRDRRLRALGVAPLRLRVRDAVVAAPAPAPDEALPTAASAIPPPAPVIRRLALQPDQAALDDPAVRKMYASLTEAVGKAGLQRVRVCDVADDPGAAVVVFDGAPVPDGVPASRLLHVESLAVLHTDRGRKRALWERMQALGRGGSA